MRLRAFFKYFGSKHSLIESYPTPKHSCIIEPFAGSAAYATYYHEKDVILNELEPDMYLLWKWLITEATPGDIRGLPVDLKEGRDIRELDIPYGAQLLIRIWQYVGHESLWSVRKPATEKGSWNCWTTRARERVASQIRHIRHWRVTNTSYESVVQDAPATWFIDPPYIHNSHMYGCPPINYNDLGRWCQSRPGQVIVCEADGAQWLPFKYQNDVFVCGGTSRHKTKEVVWVNDPEYMKKLDRKPIVMGNVFDMR